MILRAPAPLSTEHDTSAFDCGVADLNKWLTSRGLANHRAGASRVYVIAGDDMRVIGYYALASGGIAAADTPGRFRRNMPDPIPVVILGRLAIDQRHQGRGLGADLLRDAVLRALEASRLIGIRGMVVQAKDDQAGAFYRRWGFTPTPTHPLMLLATANDLAAAFLNAPG